MCIWINFLCMKVDFVHYYDQNLVLADVFIHQIFRIVVTIYENFILWLKHGINQQKTLKTRNFTLYGHFWPINQNFSNHNQNY